VTSAAILATGVVSELTLGVPIGLPDPPIFAIFGVVVFGVGANACYTGGWVGELLVRRAWPEESDQFGTLMFTLGLPFAVVVTLSPAVLIAGVAVLYAIARWLGYAGPIE
jgi:hypothetical protein